MHHIILLGDSTFDNREYIPGKADVIHQLSSILPYRWNATLRAVDGSITGDIRYQLEDLPEDASFLIVSVGGNDALGHIDIINQEARSVGEVLLKLAEIKDDFQKAYQGMLAAVTSHDLPTPLCTIYNPRFPDILIQRMASVALSIFNDVIISEAYEVNAGVIDLRSILNENNDYANPIEPSETGGKKIADEILRIVKGHSKINL